MKYKVQSQVTRRKKCGTSACKRYGAKSSKEKLAHMRVNKGYVYEADTKNIDELKGRK